jgi:hypothetical protein
MMSTATNFPSVRNQGLIISRKKPNVKRWCPLASRQLRTIYKAPHPSFALRAAIYKAPRPSFSPVCLKQRVWAYRVESNSNMRESKQYE